MQYGEGVRIDCIHLIERVESWAGHEHFGSMSRAYRNDRVETMIALRSLGRCLLRVVSLCSACPLCLPGVLYVLSLLVCLSFPSSLSFYLSVCLSLFMFVRVRGQNNSEDKTGNRKRTRAIKAKEQTRVQTSLPLLARMTSKILVESPGVRSDI